MVRAATAPYSVAFDLCHDVKDEPCWLRSERLAFQRHCNYPHVYTEKKQEAAPSLRLFNVSKIFKKSYLQRICISRSMSTLSLATFASCASAGGWDPVDAAGVHRYAAIGLFDTMTPLQATVEKSSRNPLFNQTKPWETRLDNGYPNVVYDEASAANGDGPWRLWYGNIGVGGGQYLVSKEPERRIRKILVISCVGSSERLRYNHDIQFCA